MWVLGNESWSSGRAALTAEPSLHPVISILICVRILSLLLCSQGQCCICGFVVKSVGIGPNCLGFICICFLQAELLWVTYLTPHASISSSPNWDNKSSINPLKLLYINTCQSLRSRFWNTTKAVASKPLIADWSKEVSRYKVWTGSLWAVGSCLHKLLLLSFLLLQSRLGHWPRLSPILPLSGLLPWTFSCHVLSFESSGYACCNFLDCGCLLPFQRQLLSVPTSSAQRRMQAWLN